MRAALLLSIFLHGILLRRWEPSRPVPVPFWGNPQAVELAPLGAERPVVGRGRGGGARRREGAGGGTPAPETASLGELLGRGNRPPEYPAEAIRREWEGTVRLAIRFDPEGRFEQAEIIQSSGHRVLDEAARRAAREWTWVRSSEGRVVVVPIEFSLEGA